MEYKKFSAIDLKIMFRREDIDKFFEDFRKREFFLKEKYGEVFMQIKNLTNLWTSFADKEEGNFIFVL